VVVRARALNLELITKSSVNRLFYEPVNDDELVKNRNSAKFVIPAKAGIQLFQDVLDPGVRRGDGFGDFLRSRHN
jgi:hypothetical protein